MLGNLILQIGSLYSLCIVIYCIFTWIPLGSSGVLADIANSVFSGSSYPLLEVRWI